MGNFLWFLSKSLTPKSRQLSLQSVQRSSPRVHVRWIPGLPGERQLQELPELQQQRVGRPQPRPHLRAERASQVDTETWG